jgi:hypothetical protein
MAIFPQNIKRPSIECEFDGLFNVKIVISVQWNILIDLSLRNSFNKAHITLARNS